MGIILLRLSGIHERCMRQNQTGSRPGRGCTDQIFALTQILEHRQIFHRPTISVFPDLKAVLDSVDRAVL